MKLPASLYDLFIDLPISFHSIVITRYQQVIEAWHRLSGRFPLWTWTSAPWVNSYLHPDRYFRVIDKLLLGGGGGTCTALKMISSLSLNLTKKQWSEARNPTVIKWEGGAVPQLGGQAPCFYSSCCLCVQIVWKFVPLASMLHGPASPAAQCHFSPMTVPFSI